MSNYHKIAKLNGAENYSAWEVAVRSEMVYADIFDVLEDSYTIPTKGSSRDTIPAVGGPDRHDYTKYISVNRKALAAIHLTVKPHIYAQIKLITDARQSWKKLKELYGENTEAMFESALYKLSSIELKDYKDLPTYLSAFRECTAKMEEMGSPCLHKHQVAFYKRGLPQYLQEHMFTISQYDVRDKREVNLGSITVELENRIQSDRPHERMNETSALRGNHSHSGKQRTRGQQQSSRGGVRAGSQPRDRDPTDHKHNGDPCRYGKDCYREYPSKKPSWMKQNKKQVAVFSAESE